jgi:hypothetical protein
MNKTLQTGGGGAGYFVFAPGIAKGRIEKKRGCWCFTLQSFSVCSAGPCEKEQ